MALEDGVRYRVGRWVVDPRSRQISANGHPTELNWRAFEALHVLAEARGAVVRREELFERLWPGVAVDESSLNKCISQLRKTLGNGSGEEYVETVPRVGYRLIAPVEEWTTDSASAQFTRPARRMPNRLAIAAACVGLTAAAGYFGWRWYQHSETLRDADENYRKGEDLSRQRDKALIPAAVAYYQRSIQLNPKRAEVYAALAQTINRSNPQVNGKLQMTPLEVAERGVQVDPKCVACQISLGFFLFYYDWQWERAEQHLRKALDLAPENPNAQVNFAMLLASTGRLGEALERVDRGLQTTPYQATWHAIRASVLYFLRRYPEAVVAADRAISLDRTNTAAWDWRSKALYQLGRGEDAVRAMADFPFANRAADLDRACRERGVKGGWEQLLAITDDGQSRLHQCWRRATWFAFLGDSDRALDELEKALELRNPNLAWIAVDPAYESLWAHPRFRSILERMKLRG